MRRILVIHSVASASLELAASGEIMSRVDLSTATPVRVQAPRCLFILAMMVWTSACGAALPSADDARTLLQQRLDGGNESRLQLTSFQKTDGRSLEVMGVKVYELMFRAVANFKEDALFAVAGGTTFFGTSLDGRVERITTSPYKARSGNFMQDFGLDFNNLRPARKGDNLDLAGRISFEKRESGWVATNTSFSITLQKGIAGQWYDGGPYCAEAGNRTSEELVLKLWYCEVGIENAGELVLVKTKDGYSDRDGKASIQLSADDVLTVDLRKEVSDKVGNAALGQGQTRFRRQ